MRSFLQIDSSSNDFIAILIQSFFSVHGLLLGLLTVSTYENMNAMQDIASNEATAISILLRDVAGLPPATKDKIQYSIKGYAKEVVNNSWPKLAKKEPITGERKYVNSIINEFFAFSPKTKNEEIVLAESLKQFNNLLEIRKSRLSKFDDGIPDALWAVVFVGAIIIILLILCCDYSYRIHIFGSTVFCFYLGMTIYVILSMDNPLVGYDSVAPDMLDELLKNMDDYSDLK
jgi:Protein of unknown function (DUF4239)